MVFLVLTMASVINRSAGKERQFQLLERDIVGRVLVAIDYQKPAGVCELRLKLDSDSG